MPTLTRGNLTLDFAARRVVVAGCEVALTPTEYALLALLAKHTGRVITSHQLTTHVLGDDTPGALHILRVHISNLRKKLRPTPDAPPYIHTVTGVGFRFESPSSVP
ncbi:MAG: KDP operon transcriptional regulatory protein KdpE [bacterium ADurb.Bin429]|nr:MAG: KDP operon transcriptional regulatory protein KdpE [bacterium ADurb.Bin429]